jgi:molybdopterin/thiamine biosynthesis adenylyltransferase
MLLSKITKDKNLPLVHGAVGGHTGQVMTIFPEDDGLNKIYGMAGTFPEKGIEAELGTLPAVVFMVAAAQCTEVIKVLLGKQNILRDKLLVMDPFDGVFRILPI